MKNTIIMWTMMVLLSLLTACGGSDSSEDSNFKSDDSTADDSTATEGPVLEDTASEVVTTLADINGFNIVANIRNPRTDFYGTEVEITAYVKDHSNNWVEDGTVITFVADDFGAIPDQCTTVNGRCKVTWVSSEDRTEGYADIPVNRSNDRFVTIMGRTIGEDSFIDKNGNSKFDTNEVWMTQSEPFLDSNDDGVYNPEVDEFDERMDFNGNGIFDEVFEKFRGESCSDAAISAGHCKTKVEIWATTRLIASVAGEATVSLTDCNATSYTNINVNTSTTYCILVVDENGNTPPVGTQISATVDILEVEVPPKAAVAETGDANGYSTEIRLKPKLADGETSGTLIIKVTSVDDKDAYLYVPVSDPS